MSLTLCFLSLSLSLSFLSSKSLLPGLEVVAQVLDLEDLLGGCFFGNFRKEQKKRGKVSGVLVEVEKKKMPPLRTKEPSKRLSIIIILLLLLSLLLPSPLLYIKLTRCSGRRVLHRGRRLGDAFSRRGRGGDERAARRGRCRRRPRSMRLRQGRRRRKNNLSSRRRRRARRDTSAARRAADEAAASRETHVRERERRIGRSRDVKRGRDFDFIDGPSKALEEGVGRK